MIQMASTGPIYLLLKLYIKLSSPYPVPYYVYLQFSVTMYIKGVVILENVFIVLIMLAISVCEVMQYTDYRCRAVTIHRPELVYQ